MEGSTLFRQISEVQRRLVMLLSEREKIVRLLAIAIIGHVSAIFTAFLL